MDKKIILFLFICLCTLRAESHFIMPASIDEVGQWNSWEEVVLSSSRLFDAEAKKPAGAVKLMMAVQSGLRSIEYSEQLDLKNAGPLKNDGSALVLLVIKGRTIREIAILGHLMVLAEARHLDISLEGTFARAKIEPNGLAQDIIERRSQSLKALSVLRGK